MNNSSDYARLQEQLTDPQREVSSAGHVETDAAAAAAGHAFLLREYGSEKAIIDAMGLPRGRPRVGQSTTGPSPTVRGRISDAEYAAFQRLAQATGRSQSELVREAVHRLLVEHQLVS